MIIRIGEFEISECWNGVFYKKLSNYPKITAWEIQTVLDFARYEESNGRLCKIEAEKDIILANGSGKQEWIEKLKRYKGIKELDRSFITFLIERIDVIDGNTIQVTYRFREEAEELERLAELYSVEIKEAV